MTTPLRPIPLPTPSPDAQNEAQTDPGAALYLAIKKQYGMYSGAEVEQIDRFLPSARHLVEGLIPPGSVNILVGDSGIGKSPMAYQLGLAVAGGVPFLGLPAREGRVLFLDYENMSGDARRIATQQRKHVGLKAASPNFLLWLMPATKDGEHESVESIVQKLAPDLVIIDSLRAFHPEMESTSVEAVRQIRRFRVIAKQRGTAFLLIHHVRRQQLLATADLENGHALDWLRRASGVRALINQTDVRLALGLRTTGEDLVLGGHYRTRGAIGPFLIRRAYNGDGEPTGYARFEPDPALIANGEQEAAFAELPGDFSFAVAQDSLRKPPETTNQFIHKLIRLGLAKKVARGKYQKSI